MEILHRQRIRNLMEAAEYIPTGNRLDWPVQKKSGKMGHYSDESTNCYYRLLSRDYVPSIKLHNGQHHVNYQ